MAGNSAIQEFCVFEPLFPFSSFLSDQVGNQGIRKKQLSMASFHIKLMTEDYSVILLGICIVITRSNVKLKYI